MAALKAAPAKASDFGTLPEWDLSHLYPAMDSPEFREDLARAEGECKALAEAYRGRLDELARADDAAARLGEAVQRYEAIEDLLGRLMSYAGLVYSGDITDQKRMKFYGDTQDRLTAASSVFLYFTLEHYQFDVGVI